LKPPKHEKGVATTKLGNLINVKLKVYIKQDYRFNPTSTQHLPLERACNTAAHSQNTLCTRTGQPSQTDEVPKAPASKKSQM
jgi:hypothetical protein